MTKGDPIFFNVTYFASGSQLEKWVIYGKLSHTLKQMGHTCQHLSNLGHTGQNKSRLTKWVAFATLEQLENCLTQKNGLLLENLLSHLKI